MNYEVIVIGGGIGGLTTAALLAARGVNVCLFEKESRAGGCVAAEEHHGYRFEPGAGLYASWQPGDIHERVFAELPVTAPDVRQVSPPYVVRLPDACEVNVSGSDAEFESQLRQAFPECAAAAVAFYREMGPVAAALHRAARRIPDLPHASRLQRIKLAASEPRAAPHILARSSDTAATHLQQTSSRFRRFIDAQLQIFAQCASGECAYLYSAVALCLPRREMYAIRGGGAALADTFIESIKSSGGTVRLDTSVLRLACDAGGRAVGVDLLSGEAVTATRAIVSNLTVWDTYGKLVGLNRTPADVRARLKTCRGWGAYLIYVGVDEEACARLSAERVLALTDWQDGGPEFNPEHSLFMFSAAPAWDRRAPSGKRAATIATFTEPEQWFTFHRGETEHEAQDQAALEAWWGRLHEALPELGSGVEVIETATPRTFYERTRRKLGMVGGVGQSLGLFGTNSLTHCTAVPNLYMVGDTMFPGQGVAAVTHSALIVANKIAPPTG
ncbi:MAG: NAD(P)/FAD-dependent oxidoreductase [Acidobacteriota bacterium]|nr:NAD(P)/FAD-dependent oxidoreductase [Acidobacteriota bacterium]